MDRPHPCPERQHEEFIETIGVFGKIQEAGLHHRQNVDHAEAVIHEDADGGRNIFLFENGNLLLISVLIDPEVVCRETRHELSCRILHGEDDVDEIHIDCQSPLRGNSLEKGRGQHRDDGKAERFLQYQP